MSDLLQQKPRTVALSYNLTTAINESSTTVGIADSDLYGMSQADIVATFDQMQSLGVNTVRVLVPWGDIYKVPPGDLLEFFFPPDWSKVDFIVNEAASRNMSVLGVLNATPYWGGQDGSGCLGCYGVAPDPQKFAAFAALAAQRFGDKVSAYEVWNEPNYVASWGPEIDPVAYTELLKQAYTAIKGANPDATVVAGVLGTVTTFGGITLDARDFVETMYANGAQGFFDALSIHPYQYTTKFSEGEHTWYEPWKANSPLEQMIAIRQLMIDNGDEALRIWATEYGLPTGGPNAVTPEQQAQFIEDFLNAWSELDYAGPSFIYTTRDRLEGVVTEDGSFGLFYFDLTTLQWTAKSAAEVIKDFIEAHPPGSLPPGPSGPPDLGAQIAQALQQFFNQMQAAFQGFVDSMNAFVAAVSQAIANIFNPGGVAAVSLAPEIQEEVAEGTTMAAKAVAEDTAVGDTETSESDATEAEDAAAETVSVDQTTEATEATQAPEATETEVDETEASTEAVGDDDATEDESTETEAVETDTSETVAESDTDSASAGGVTETDSREPVRTGLVARPGEVGDDDTDDAGDVSDDATNEAGSEGESDSGESGAAA
ncbi:cellulase family glycosylhydrolase [Mycobacterium sp.]|uniref:cellulase family glycosylhydrolase n=1 Tax=Mycobacterium sp. TaxID=1785 RepID=UPI002D917002|nr:cellulase family glycosylhydrolase [Mycobacterium sp.]